MSALFDYEAAESNELGFRKGDILLRTQTLNDSWFLAYRALDGVTGMVPSNYFKQL